MNSLGFWSFDNRPAARRDILNFTRSHLITLQIFGSDDDDDDDDEIQIMHRVGSLDTTYFLSSPRVSRLIGNLPSIYAGSVVSSFSSHYRNGIPDDTWPNRRQREKSMQIE